MSRIGKKPIPIPKNVQVSCKDGVVTVKGPKGELQRTLHPEVGVMIEDGEIKILQTSPGREDTKSLWGLFRSLISNMVTGVTEGFSKTLEVNGTGWKFEMRDKRTIQLFLGFSHPLYFEVPKGVDADLVLTDKDRQKSDKTNLSSLRITLSSIDNELLGQTCATIRAYRPPEPYKGKGIKYLGEVIRRKVGKAGTK
jgi:large subunit ribosomal protein L6